MLVFTPRKQCRNVATTRIVGITNCNEPIIYCISEKDNHFIFHDADALAKNDDKRVTLQPSVLNSHAKQIPGDVHVRHPEPDENQFPTLALF